MKVNDRLVGECADAVLALADGTTVECSKFVVMATCPVLRAMLELQTDVTADGKYVIPVLDTGRRKYEQFCKLIHCVEHAHDMSFDDLVHVHDCARRFGCEDVEKTVLMCAWECAPRPKTASVSDLLGDLLRLGPDVVAEVLETASVELPLWVDLEKKFLARLDVTDQIARDLVLLQHHYPPSAVAKWVLTHLQQISEDLVFKVATSNAHLYGANESRAVYQEMIRLYKANPSWDGHVTRFAFAVLESTAWNNYMGVTGTHVEYEDIPRTAVYVSFLPKHKFTRKTIALAPCLRIRMPCGGRAFEFDVDTFAKPVQVRVTASRRLSMLDPFFEAWYAFDAGTGWTTSPVPTASFGEIPPGPVGTVGFSVRFDIRHGTANALTNPYAHK